MPTVENGAVRLRYTVAGKGETVVFVNDVGAGAWLWSYLQPAIAGPYRTAVWDLRGTGESDAPDGPYTVEALVGDLEAVVRAVEARRVHLVGAGLGGAIALEYARKRSNVASLTLLGTASGSAVDGDALESLAAPREDPTALRSSLSRAFVPTVLEEYTDEIDRIVAWRASDDADPDGWSAQQAAWLDASLADLYEITTPALVLGGTADQIVDPAATARLARALPRGEHRELDGGHYFPVSESQALADELLAWLDEHARETSLGE